MTTPPPDPALTAALLQISGHAERIAALDDRYHQLAGALTQVTARAADDTASRDSVLASLDALDHQVTALAARLATLPDTDDPGDAPLGGYQPVLPPRWWKIQGPEREHAAARLRAWVTQVYQHSYGHLAAQLPPCWEQHPLCLHTLDWLSELWSVLYLTADRGPGVLAAQAEWQTRLLPAAAAQMAAEAATCPHTTPPRRPAGTGQPPQPASPSTPLPQ